MMTSLIPEIEDCETFIGLCLAINAKDLKMIDRLLQQPNLDFTVEGMIALYYAISCNAPDMAHKLIQKGVDPNVCPNIYTRLLLHQATHSNSLECVCMLLSCGVDLQRNSKHTPLMIAYKKNNKNIMKALLYHYYEFDGTNLANIDLNLQYVRCENEDILLLFIALHNGYVEPFKIVWSRIDIELLAKLPLSQDFLSRYLLESTFTPTEWLDCLYLILESPHFLKLLNVHQKFLFYLFVALSLKEFEDDRELDTLYMCLSVGINVKFDDIIGMCNLNKKKEMIDAIIYSANNNLAPPKDDLYLSLYILLTCKMDSNTKNVFSYFEKELHCTRNLTNFIRWFKYFSFPQSMKNRLLNSINWYSDQQKELLYQVPEFPSLLELARLQVQRNIRETHTIKTTYQFHDAAKQLCLPKQLIDIVLFKRPIYMQKMY